MSDHLKFVIPGAVLSAIAAFMLLFGGLFAMISRLSCGFPFGDCGSPSIMGSMGTSIVIIGIVLLCVGIILIAKGISVYKGTSSTAYKYNKPTQPISYTPSSTPSFAPVSIPTYAPVTQPSSFVINAPTPIQDPTPPKETMAPEKKYCPSCGAALPEGSQAHFCPTCGGPI